MFRTLILSAAIATAAISLPAHAAVRWGVSIDIAPPAPMVVAVPAPRVGFVWAPGYWNWSGGKHVWMNGSWMPARAGYAYWEPRWVQRDGKWHFDRGGWGRNDRDRDGIPNRRDKDRDGDGVPNKYDKQGNHPTPQ